MTWAELTPGKIQSLVRVLARDSEKGRGARTAEYMCDMLYTIAAWLRQDAFSIPSTRVSGSASGVETIDVRVVAS